MQIFGDLNLFAVHDVEKTSKCYNCTSKMDKLLLCWDDILSNCLSLHTQIEWHVYTLQTNI